MLYINFFEKYLYCCCENQVNNCMNAEYKYLLAPVK